MDCRNLMLLRSSLTIASSSRVKRLINIIGQFSSSVNKGQCMHERADRGPILKRQNVPKKKAQEQ